MHNWSFNVIYQYHPNTTGHPEYYERNPSSYHCPSRYSESVLSDNETKNDPPKQIYPEEIPHFFINEMPRGHYALFFIIQSIYKLRLIELTEFFLGKKWNLPSKFKILACYSESYMHPSAFHAGSRVVDEFWTLHSIFTYYIVISLICKIAHFR